MKITHMTVKLAEIKKKKWVTVWEYLGGECYHGSKSETMPSGQRGDPLGSAIH